MVKALVSCFHGPQVEASFGVMNDIINGKTNRMNVDTYNAIQGVKYGLKATGKSRIEYFHKEDFLHERANPSLVRNMQSSSGIYKEP